MAGISSHIELRPLERQHEGPERHHHPEQPGQHGQEPGAPAGPGQEGQPLKPNAEEVLGGPPKTTSAAGPRAPSRGHRIGEGTDRRARMARPAQLSQAVVSEVLDGRGVGPRALAGRHRAATTSRSASLRRAAPAPASTCCRLPPQRHVDRGRKLEALPAQEHPSTGTHVNLAVEPPRPSSARNSASQSAAAFGSSSVSASTVTTMSASWAKHRHAMFQTRRTCGGCCPRSRSRPPRSAERCRPCRRCSCHR